MNYKLASQEKVLGNNRRITLLGITVDVLTIQETMNLVEKYVITKTPLHLMGVNADKINEAHHNERMKQIINSCGVVNADGASVVLASKFLNKPLPERVAGVDLMLRLIELSAAKGYSVYLLGGKQTVVEKTVTVLKNKHHGLNIVGFHNGYFSKSDWPIISKQINEKKPDFVFVGITSPLKEYLIEYFQDENNKSVFMGVGGSFDVISGNIKRAPRWMQKSNLEWLFRVIQEPRRLFKRYFLGNIKFINLVLREIIKCRM